MVGRWCARGELLDLRRVAPQLLSSARARQLRIEPPTVEIVKIELTSPGFRLLPGVLAFLEIAPCPFSGIDRLLSCLLDVLEDVGEPVRQAPSLPVRPPDRGVAAPGAEG